MRPSAPMVDTFLGFFSSVWREGGASLASSTDNVSVSRFYFAERVEILHLWQDFTEHIGANFSVVIIK